MTSKVSFFSLLFHATWALVVLQSNPAILYTTAALPARTHWDPVDEERSFRPEHLLLPSDWANGERIDEKPKNSFPSSTEVEAEGQARLECSVTEFGAQGSGLGFDTVAIQAAINACAFQNGLVRFPPGKYLTATIFLKSNLTVQIDAGATILGSPYQQDYPSERDRWYVILAEGAENVKITGGGTIDGQGLKFVKRFDPRKNVMVSWNTTGDCYGDECRPRLVGFVNCKNVEVWDVYLHEPAYWW